MVETKTSLTFYGGVNEIGGNKILLQDRDTRVFFDFGMSFSAKKQFYSPPFLSPKNERSLQELGILPKLNGVLTRCFCHMGIWTIRLICRLSSARFLCIVVKQLRRFCEP